MKIEDVTGLKDWDYFFNYALPCIPFEQNRKRTKDIALRTAIGNKALKKAIYEICAGTSIEGKPKYKEESIIQSYLCVWNAFKKSNFNMYRFMKEKSYLLIEDDDLRIEILMDVFFLLKLPIANYMVDWMNGYFDFFEREPNLRLSDIDKDNSNDRIVTDTDVMVALFNCTREKEIWQLTSRGLGKIEDLFRCYMGITDPFIEETTGIPCYIEKNREKVMAFPREYVSFGVVKLNKFAGYNSVSVYKGLYDYTNLQGFAGSRGMSAVDARWADDIIVVTMDDGSIRRYSDWNRYDTIR